MSLKRETSQPVGTSLSRKCSALRVLIEQIPVLVHITLVENRLGTVLVTNVGACVIANV